MQYWCEEYTMGNGYPVYLYRKGNGFGYYDGYGHLALYSPSMLVTGVKLEEVVLNAVLV